MTEKFSLSAKGLSHAFSAKDEDDFTFIVGEKEYKCNHIQACFLSPRVHQLMQTDPFCDEYKIIIPDDDDKFEVIIDLINGRTISFDQSTYVYMMQMGQLLGNNEIVDKAGQIMTVDYDTESVFEVIEQKRKFGCSLEKELSFIASNFCECSISNLCFLTSAEIRSILNMKDYLKLTSEDSLYEIILQLAQHSSDYADLFECISLENLSYANMMQFISMVSLDFLTHQIWQNICHRIKSDISQLENCDHFLQQKFKSFQLNPKEPLKGIFHYLWEICQGNIHKNKIVIVTASSEGGNKPFQVVNHKWSHYFFTKDEPNAWLCFDFGPQRVSLTDYTIKSAPYGPGACHLKSWVIEGSDDCKMWETLDKRVNDNSLNASSAIKSFHVKRFPEYRYIRLRIIGEDHHRKHYLQLASIEFFGELFPPEKKIFQSAAGSFDFFPDNNSNTTRF